MIKSKIGRIIFMTACLVLFQGGPLGADEWPERAVTLVSSLPPTLPWADEANPQALIMEELKMGLSRELGVSVILASRPQGRGILAGNMVAASKPDGHLMAALGPDPALTLVIQGYTPYTWAEIAPVSTVWRMFPAIVVRADFPAEDLRDLARMDPAPRLAHTGLDPLNSNTYLALAAARAAGFTWHTIELERIDPALLLDNQADALVMPLGWLEMHPEAGRFKVLTILTNEKDPPCGRGRPTLGTQGLEGIGEEPPLALYLPAKADPLIRGRLVAAINAVLGQKTMTQSILEACLKPCAQDLEGTALMMNTAYEHFADGWAAVVPNGAEK